MRELDRKYKIALGVMVVVAVLFNGYRWISSSRAKREADARAAADQKLWDDTIAANKAKKAAKAGSAGDSMDKLVAQEEKAIAKERGIPSRTPSPVPSPSERSAPQATPQATPQADSEDKLERELKRLSRRGYGRLVEEWKRNHGDASWAQLIAMAGNRKIDIGERYFALHAGLDIGGAAAGSEVAKLLNDNDPGIRCLSLLGLGDMRDPALAVKIAPSLRDRAMVVRDCALIAILRTEGAGARRYLIETVSDEENYVRGTPLPIVKRAFDLLRLIEPDSTHADACKVFRQRTKRDLFDPQRRRWGICQDQAP